jgi:hypothetical protein
MITNRPVLDLLKLIPGDVPKPAKRRPEYDAPTVEKDE